MEQIATVGMNVHLGTQPVLAGSHWSSTMQSGLWLACLLNGQIHVEREDMGERTWSSGSVFCIWQDDAVETFHSATGDAELDYVFIHVTQENLELMFGDDFQGRIGIGGSRNRILMEPESPALAHSVRSMAWQMMNPSVNGPGRRFYVAGKALEMLGATLEFASDVPLASEHIAQSRKLSPTEIEAVYLVRSAIMRNLRNPPTVDELAREVGVNSRKLSEGFNAVFGLPVYAFIKASRLQQARLMIEAGEKSVSKVAYAFGYTPGHFSTEFRSKYGVSPKAWIQKI